MVAFCVMMLAVNLQVFLTWHSFICTDNSCFLPSKTNQRRKGTERLTDMSFLVLCQVKTNITFIIIYIYIYIYIRFVPSSFPYFLIWNLYYYYYFKKHILVNHTVCTHNKPNYYLMKNHIKSSFCCQNMKWSWSLKIYYYRCMYLLGCVVSASITLNSLNNIHTFSSSLVNAVVLKTN